MLLFFGTRSSKIGTHKLRNVTCPNCDSQNTLIVSTYSNYLHLFWIPLFPMYKSYIATCTNCNETFSYNEFTEPMRQSFEKEKLLQKHKRPIWQGCGCFLFLLFFMVPMFISLAYYLIYPDAYKKTTQNYSKEVLQLQKDINSATNTLNKEKDTIAYALQQCIIYDIVKGINTQNIKYKVKVNGNKLLVIAKISDIKKVEKSSRKELVFAIEDCLNDQNLKSITEYYIGVDGNWNMLMVKTPTYENLKGKFADKEKLTPFYFVTDSLKIETNTSIKRDSLAR